MEQAFSDLSALMAKAQVGWCRCMGGRGAAAATARFLSHHGAFWMSEMPAVRHALHALPSGSVLRHESPPTRPEMCGKLLSKTYEWLVLQEMVKLAEYFKERSAAKRQGGCCAMRF